MSSESQEDIGKLTAGDLVSVTQKELKKQYRVDWCIRPDDNEYIFEFEDYCGKDLIENENTNRYYVAHTWFGKFHKSPGFPLKKKRGVLVIDADSWNDSPPCAQNPSKLKEKYKIVADCDYRITCLEKLG